MSQPNNVELHECLCCGMADLMVTCNLGVQPLANNYSDELEEQPHYPLVLNTCPHCWHSQLSLAVDRKIIFDNYAYVSGTSRTLLRYFDWFASALAMSGTGAKVFEIAANDGSLLRALEDHGFDVSGIDPAGNIVETAAERGLRIVKGYFPQDLQPGETYDVVIAMNVLAHVDSPLSFLQGLNGILTDRGIAVIQTSQARMFEQAQFDTIYHEHISFFNSRSLSVLAERAGLRLLGGCLVKIHGDSALFFLAKDLVQIDLNPFTVGEFGLGENLAAYEAEVAKLFDVRRYLQFEGSVQDILRRLVATIEGHRKEGFEIYAVGAAAKAMTVFNAAGLDVQFLDEAPMKIGKLPPGSTHRVKHFNAIQQTLGRALFVIGAWNFADEIKAKLRALNSSPHHRFIVYFPTIAYI